jgi:hypothetical protein
MDAMNEQATVQSSRDGRFDAADSGATTVAEVKRKLELLECRFTMPLPPQSVGGGGTASSSPAVAGSPTATHNPEQNISAAMSLTTTAPSIPVAFSPQMLRTNNSQHSFGFDHAPAVLYNGTSTSRSHPATTEHSKRVSSSPVAVVAPPIPTSAAERGDGRTTPDWQTIAAQHMAKVAMEQQQQQEQYSRGLLNYNAHSQDRTLLTSHVVIGSSTTAAHSQLATKEDESNISLIQESPAPLSSLPLAIPIEATAMKAIYVRTNVGSVSTLTQ